MKSGMTEWCFGIWLAAKFHDIQQVNMRFNMIGVQDFSYTNIWSTRCQDIEKLTYLIEDVVRNVAEGVAPTYIQTPIFTYQNRYNWPTTMSYMILYGRGLPFFLICTTTASPFPHLFNVPLANFSTPFKIIQFRSCTLCESSL